MSTDANAAGIDLVTEFVFVVDVRVRQANPLVSEFGGEAGSVLEIYVAAKAIRVELDLCVTDGSGTHPEAIGKFVTT